MVTTRATPTSSKPAAKAKEKKPTVHFDIEQAENEVDDDEVKEPFHVRLKSGDVITLRDPYEVGWKEAASVGPDTPYLFIQTMVKEEDYDEFIKTDFKTRAMQKMVLAYREHYGLPTPGN